MVETALHLEYVHVPLCGLAMIVDKVRMYIVILLDKCINIRIHVDLQLLYNPIAYNDFTDNVCMYI